MKNLINTQTAHITQLTSKSGPGDWVVYNGEKEIYRLPMDMNERHAMAALRMARTFELEALNTGIRFGKNIVNCDVDKYKQHIRQLSADNIKLSNYIEKLTKD